MLQIQNRRYIGSKYKLREEIYRQACSFFDANTKFQFADLFAGTGSVAYYFAKKNHRVIVNDILYSNFVAYEAWFGNKKINLKKINTIIDNWNSINPNLLNDNYFSKIYSEKYYSLNNAKKIGFIREDLENIKNNLNSREYFILLTSLIYAADSIANTVGHFESFLKKKPLDKNLFLKKIQIDKIKFAKIFNMDANQLSKEIYADVIYIDPPYNARQYINFYHVLENLALWNKPTKFEGISMKFERNHLKSSYSTNRAKRTFSDLIQNLKCKLIIVSYNNTYCASSSASNNKISENDLKKILQKKGKIAVKEFKYNFFNAGKTNLKNHREKLYICRVENE